MPRDMTHWTEEMLAIAVGMKRAGLSHKAIAERLGVTVCAVANRLNRAKARRRLDKRPGGSRPMSQRLDLNRRQHIYEEE